MRPQESVAVHAPERVERAIERREVVAAMDEERAARVVHVLAGADVHVLQRLGDVKQAPHVHLEAQRAEQAAEDEQVVEEGGHQRAAARAMRPASASPRTAAMSSLDLSATPSVASTASGSSVSELSAASAATQSSVSDTPGTL